MSVLVVRFIRVRIWWCALLMVGCLILQSVQAAQAVQLNNVRTWSQNGTTRIVFDLNDDVDYQVFTLSNPMRLVVDFKSTVIKKGFDTGTLNGAIFKDVRWGIQNGSDLRVVIDLNKPVVFSQFPLGPQAGQKGSRVVVDMQQGDGQKSNDDAVAAAAIEQSSNASKPSMVNNDPIAAIIAQQQANNAQRQAESQPATPQVAQAVSPTANRGRGRDIVVVIDPGHGGKDPGTMWPDGSREKDIVLQVGKRLKALFDAAPGFTAKMTRSGDYFIPLRGRTEIARKDHADFFVSVHVDAAKSTSARGTSVYALSQHGATSESARWLAQSENNSDLIGGSDGNLALDDKDQMLRGVLLDLSMTATINASLAAGHQLINQVSKFNELHTGRVDQAGFVVLKSPDIPSLLVETGYISNATERALLKTPAHQQRIAQAIFSGIVSYFRQHPPSGTYMANQEASQLASNQYRVRPGDSLQSIAARQKVSIADLKRANNMKMDVVQPGQVLTIP